METRTTSGYFSDFSILSLVLGVGFLCVCLIFWWFTRQKAYGASVRKPRFVRDEVETLFTKFDATPMQVYGLSRMMFALL
jgi:hypothetical protein